MRRLHGAEKPPPRLTEGHQPARVFVPQRQLKCRKALRKRNHGRAVEERILVVTTLEIVVWNPRAEVVNVVQSDASREPLQHRGKTEMRAASDRRFRVVPLLVPLPVGALELMLHEEQEDAAGER